MNNNKTLWSLLASICALGAGCTSGVLTIAMVTIQIHKRFMFRRKSGRTPVSAKTIFTKNTAGNGLQKALLASTGNSCIQLTTQNNGQNYIESYTGSQWWSSAYVTVGITNTCSTPQAFSPQIVF